MAYVLQEVKLCNFVLMLVTQVQDENGKTFTKTLNLIEPTLNNIQGFCGGIFVCSLVKEDPYLTSRIVSDKR